VLTGGKVEPKELVRLEIEAPEGEPLFLWAEVVEAASRLALRCAFTSITDDDGARLGRLLLPLSKENPDRLKLFSSKLLCCRNS